MLDKTNFIVIIARCLPGHPLGPPEKLNNEICGPPDNKAAISISLRFGLNAVPFSQV